MAFLSIGRYARLTCRVTLERSIKSGPGVISRHHDDAMMRDENQGLKVQ
jgi:hypothetical protein